MTDNYILMHRDEQCGVIAIDRDSGSLTDFAPVNRKYLPFLGNADEKMMKTWWNHRAVPGSRKDMESVIRGAGCLSNTGYLARNLALSMSDTYWICPADIELFWNDINLYKLCETDLTIVPYHNGTSYDPNASLGGQMNKYWDVSGPGPVLVKKASEHYGQQSINELFATEVHERQAPDIPYVTYFERAADDNTKLSCCAAFTSGRIEFVSAYEVLRSRKLRSDRSDYEQLIDICEEHGIDRLAMQRFMDYLILSDFVISNADEHLQNFGVLRDTETMQLVGPAPIFDSGNSMFFNYNSRKRPLDRAELLEMEISSLHKSEEKMLTHVRDKHVLDAELLPSVEEVVDFYSGHGIPEEKSLFIGGSYSNKISLLRDFQKGVTVSLYHEKHTTTL